MYKPGVLVFSVTVPSRLFVNKPTFPPNNETDEFIIVPVPGVSFASMLTVFGLVVEEKEA